MHQHYKDILDRIKEAPIWFDDYGVPRFEDFLPGYMSNIYASEAVLAEISCQCCQRMFKVALTEAFSQKGFSLSDQIRLNRLHYGDPPNIGCCGAGASMNSVMHSVLEYWYRDYEISMSWQRDPTFEGDIDADAPRDPPNTFAETLASVGQGSCAILVKCTSHANRYDLAGRIAAAMVERGPVLVAYHERYLALARQMLESLVPDIDVGHWHEDRAVTVAEFSRLKELRLGKFDSVVVLAGPPARNEALQQDWNEVARRLGTEAGEKVRIEFALAHSCRMIAAPDLIIDAGRDERDSRRSP